MRWALGDGSRLRSESAAAAAASAESGTLAG